MALNVITFMTNVMNATLHMMFGYGIGGARVKNGRMRLSLARQRISRNEKSLERGLCLSLGPSMTSLVKFVLRPL